VFGRPSAGSKNKINIYAPNTDNHRAEFGSMKTGQRAGTDVSWRYLYVRMQFDPN
jgi:hypothetical protein